MGFSFLLKNDDRIVYHGQPKNIGAIGNML
jgi:hypothetical protein